MVDEPKPAVTGTVIPSGSPTAQQASADAAVNAGFQTRIDGLIAERSRWKEQAETKDAELVALREKNKTEQERLLDAARKEAVDQFKKTEWEPLATKAKKLEAHFQSEIDRLKSSFSADMIPAEFDSWPIDVRHAFLSNLKGLAKPGPVGGASNPAMPTPDRIIPYSEFLEWRSIYGNHYSAENRAKWDAKRPEMEAAIRDGRIDKTK